MAENKEDLKNLLMKVKEESEKAGLKLNIQKTKIMASGFIQSVQFSSVAQSCPTLCNPIDSSPPGSSVPGILQARTLEWVAISFSSAWKWKVKVKVKSCPTLRDPMDCSLPGSSTHGIFQARVLEWVAIDTQMTQPFQQKVKRTKELLDECERGEWKSWLKIQYSKKGRSWHLVPSLHGKQMGKWWQTLFSWAPKSLQKGTAAMKLKDACSLEEKLWPI